MQKVSQYQLAAGVFLFQLGSSPLFLLAKAAHRDAWLSVLVGWLTGLALLLAVTLPMYRLEPGKNLIGMLQAYWGKWIGGAFGFAYAIYFLYQSVRNVREFGDWTLAYLLPQTPLAIVAMVLMLVSAFAVSQGIEVFFRLAELICPAIILMYAVLFSLLAFSHLFRPEHLQPMLEHGLKPVIEAALPEVVSFPFGEMVLFLLFWTHSNRARSTSRTTIAAFAGAGLLILTANVLLIGVLGPLAEISVIPLIEAGSLFKIAERLDPIVLLLLFTCVFMKQTAYFLGAVLSLSQLTGWRSRSFLLPAGAAIYIGALSFRSYMEQVRVGFRYNLVYHFPIFEIAIPVALLAVMLIRSPKISAAGQDGGVR